MGGGATVRSDDLDSGALTFVLSQTCDLGRYHMVIFILSPLVKLGCAMVESVSKAMLVPVSAGMLNVLSVSEESGITVEGRFFTVHFRDIYYLEESNFFTPLSVN